jgi:hypothetical protein
VSSASAARVHFITCYKNGTALVLLTVEPRGVQLDGLQCDTAFKLTISGGYHCFWQYYRLRRKEGAAMRRNVNRLSCVSLAAFKFDDGENTFLLSGRRRYLRNPSKHEFRLDNVKKPEVGFDVLTSVIVTSPAFRVTDIYCLHLQARRIIQTGRTCLLLPLSCVAYPSTLKMEAICFSKARLPHKKHTAFLLQRLNQGRLI